MRKSKLAMILRIIFSKRIYLYTNGFRTLNGIHCQDAYSIIKDLQGLTEKTFDEAQQKANVDAANQLIKQP